MAEKPTEVTEKKSRKKPDPQPAPAEFTAPPPDDDGDFDADDPWMGEKPPKHYVLHEGRKLTLSGADVKLRPLPHEALVKYGIKTITGSQGNPCNTPVVIEFKSSAAAFKFFDLCLHAEDEVDEHIDAGNKTEWQSPRLVELLSGGTDEGDEE